MLIHLTLHSKKGYFHFIPNDMQNSIGYNLLGNIYLFIYLNVNKMLDIHYENKLRIYLIAWIHGGIPFEAMYLTRSHSCWVLIL
jgi:hypothetical protein